MVSFASVVKTEGELWLIIDWIWPMKQHLNDFDFEALQLSVTENPTSWILLIQPAEVQLPVAAENWTGKKCHYLSW